MQGLCGGILMNLHSEEESMLFLTNERDPKVTIIGLKWARDILLEHGITLSSF